MGEIFKLKKYNEEKLLNQKKKSRKNGKKLPNKYRTIFPKVIIIIIMDCSHYKQYSS